MSLCTIPCECITLRAAKTLLASLMHSLASSGPQPGCFDFMTDSTLSPCKYSRTNQQMLGFIFDAPIPTKLTACSHLMDVNKSSTCSSRLSCLISRSSNTPLSGEMIFMATNLSVLILLALNTYPKAPFPRIISGIYSRRSFKGR